MLPVPVLVVKSYECPAFVDAGSLVFAVSASGNTEETLQAASDAAAAGATMVVISGGGKLAELAAAWNAPVIDVPPTIPQPRAGLGAMAIPPLVVLEEMGLYRGGQYWIDAAVDQLQRRRDELAGGGRLQPRPPAIARRIGRTLPLDPWRRGRRAPPPPSAGRPRSTRTPRRRPSGAPSPSCATTRCAGGASTAMSPAS